MSKRLNYSYIKGQFNKEGYELLSNNYKNNSTKLDYICPSDHKHKITYREWYKGNRCPYCSKNIKYTYNKVKNIFEKYNYTLTSKKYINNKLNLLCICPEGHECNINLNRFLKGVRCLKCSINNKKGSGHHNWKGGIYNKKLASYNTYSDHLEKYITVHKIKQNNLELLGVNYIYCNKVFVPTLNSVNSKIHALNNITGENNLYCSDGCKKACPTYRQRLYPKGFKKATSREVQAPLRKLVLERDGWACQKCGKNKDVQLHCHHFEGIKQNPIESADIDNCITLCKTCHKEVHKSIGCRYIDLKCK